MGILLRVKWLRTVTTLAMLALWLPVTNHCRLEQIPAFAFLACCEHEDAVPYPDKDCETDGCDLVENGLYKTESNQVEIAAPLFVLIDLLLPLPADAADVLSAVQPEAAPPELSRIWQFSSRAAAPPRAPSFAS
jgi:hypothetical protein